MSLPLIMCIAGAAVFIFVFFFYIIRISRLKKARAGSSLVVPRAPVSYKGSIVAAFVLEALPFAVPMELYMVAVSLACGILGEIIVFKERIAKISENEPSDTGQSS